MMDAYRSTKNSYDDILMLLHKKLKLEKEKTEILCQAIEASNQEKEILRKALFESEEREEENRAKAQELKALLALKSNHHDFKKNLPTDSAKITGICGICSEEQVLNFSAVCGLFLFLITIQIGHGKIGYNKKPKKGCCFDCWFEIYRQNEKYICPFCRKESIDLPFICYKW